DQMKQAVDKAIAVFGAIHGVIHAAGRPDSDAQTTISETRKREANWHFVPKVYGIYALEQAFANQTLDFCIMTSSLSPMLGGLAHVAYASSNAFLDVYTRKNAQQSKRNFEALCINWEAWHNHEEIFESYGIGATLSNYFIVPEEGEEIFQRFLSYKGIAQVIVSTGDFYTRLEQWTAIHDLANEQSETGKLGEVKRERPKTKVTYVEPRNEMEQVLADVWSDLLGLESVGVHDNFFIDLGGHSLLGTQLISRLRELYQTDISLRALFEAPTIAELSEVIVRLLMSQINIAMLDDIEGLSEEAVEQLLAAGIEDPGETHG
ncbi:KR domain-containing protein, partial [Paenibacillus sp. GbtcB18]|uniref:KR domain-containing protein n=1 Tax=Paenibacillus sp. GbtcB18 TaxID=2824763 RepID=UPI001C2F59C4